MVACPQEYIFEGALYDDYLCFFISDIYHLLYAAKFATGQQAKSSISSS